MERFVIEYLESANPGLTITLPFEYESKEKALSDLHEAYLKFLEQQKHYITEYTRLNSLSEDEIPRAYTQLHKMRPNDIFLLDVHELYLPDFASYSCDNTDSVSEYSAPSIYTIDEWFKLYRTKT